MVIHHSRLTSTTGEGAWRVRRDRQRRGRERTSLATQGRRVAIPARHVQKRREAAEATEHDDRKAKVISSRLLEQAWLKQYRADYAGAWVALEGARLIAQGASARQVVDAARAGGYDQPLIVRVPSEPELPFGGW
jgi:hypothetical protein